MKRELIDEKAGESVSVYYIDNSPFIDFCLGPHVPNTNKLRAFKLLSLAGAYWKGDATLPQMQRIYGTAFFTQEQLDAWLKQREEAEKRDHRRLGKELDLFSIQEQYGQGLIFWHPKGGIIRQQMEDYLREELVRRDYSFVYTPHIAKRELWQISGHEQNYADSMFAPTDARRDGVSAQADELPVPYRQSTNRSSAHTAICHNAMLRWEPSIAPNFQAPSMA